MKHLFTEIARHSGLRVNDGNRERLERHIHSRLRRLALSDPADFIRCLQSGHPGRARELGLLAAVLTTGETFFMRDAGQMALLRQQLLPDLLEQRREQRLLRLWSAACSTGEEAYSLAILMHELLPHPGGWRIELYGTDLNSESLRQAAEARYGDWAFRGCDEDFRRRYFRPQGGRSVLKSSIRQMVQFMPLDLLLDPLPAPDRGLADVDLILCRNFFIYLRPAAAAAVTRKLVGCLRDGGLLLTGHGELQGPGPESLQPEVYPQSIVYRKGRSGVVAAGAAGCAPPPKTPHGPRPARSSAPPPGVLPGVLPVQGRGESPGRVLPPPSGPAVRRAASDAPESLDVQLQAAWRLADAGRLEESLALCRAMLALDPMRPEPHFLAGVLAMETGDTDRARQALRKALYLAPRMIAAHVHLERLQVDVGEPGAADRTRAIVARLLEDLPPDARIPFLGEVRAAEMSDASARLAGRPDTPAKGP